MSFIRKFLRNNWPILLILIISVNFLAVKIDKPFWGHHDWNGAYWGTVARNYVRYGLATKLAMVDSIGPVDPKNFSYTFHYSPLFPLIWAMEEKIFGFSETASRSFMAAISVATILVFYQIVKKYFSRSVALAACIFWVANPMFIYFGKMPVHEIPALFFILLTAYCFLISRIKLVILFTILAELTTWPGYFIVPALTFFHLVEKNKHFKPIHILALWLSSFAVFASLLVHDYLVTGSLIGGGLREIFFFRVRSVPFLPFIFQLSRWSQTYYTPILLILTACAFIFILRSKTGKWPLLAALFLTGAIYPLIFKDASFRHDYLLIYFLPFFSASAAVGLDFLARKLVVPAAITLSLIMIYVRLPFILSLENSDIYKEGVRLGRFINRNSRQNDIISYQLEDPRVGFDGWHIAYYADRKIGEGGKIFTYHSGGKITYE